MDEEAFPISDIGDIGVTPPYIGKRTRRLRLRLSSGEADLYRGGVDPGQSGVDPGQSEIHDFKVGVWSRSGLRSDYVGMYYALMRVATGISGIGEEDFEHGEEDFEHGEG